MTRKCFALSTKLWRVKFSSLYVLTCRQVPLVSTNERELGFLIISKAFVSFLRLLAVQQHRFSKISSRWNAMLWWYMCCEVNKSLIFNYCEWLVVQSNHSCTPAGFHCWYLDLIICHHCFVLTQTLSVVWVLRFARL